MIKLANNVFVSDDAVVRQCGALATLKQDVDYGAVRSVDGTRFADFNDYEGVIFVAQYIVDELNEEELGAIIAHEQGHISLGHLEKHMGAKGIVDDMTVELEADAFAAAQHGPRAMRAALGKTLSSVIAALSADHDIPKEAKGKIWRNAAKSLKPRLDALRAAM
jgi:beta-lactamase regulating signal transducer with metallopeptidase domain